MDALEHNKGLTAKAALGTRDLVFRFTVQADMVRTSTQGGVDRRALMLTDVKDFAPQKRPHGTKC